jgi:hypothetical protein
MDRTTLHCFCNGTGNSSSLYTDFPTSFGYQGFDQHLHIRSDEMHDWVRL